MMTKNYATVIGTDTGERGHIHACDGCGAAGVCCDTANGGIVIDGTETQLDLGDRVALLAGDASGDRTDEWLCEDCAA